MVGQSVSQSTASTSSSSAPILRAVLASLDIQIDEELARYRRHRLMQRRSQPKRPTPSPAASHITPSLEIGERAALPSAGADVSREVVPSPWDDSDTVAIAPLPQRHDVGDVAASPLPDDYLESTEYLLHSLADESAAPDSDEQSDRLLDVLLTPLGVGAVLLLLVASAMIGFLMVNPSILGFEKWGQIFQQGDTSSTPSGDQDPSEQSNLPVRPYPDLSADEFVDLSLDTLSTIGSRSSFLAPVASKPSPTPSASPSSSDRPDAAENLTVTPIGAIASAPTIISTNELPSSAVSAAPAPAPPPAPAVEAAPAASAPAAIPEVAPEPVAVAPEPAPAADPSGEYFYVVTDYSGDRSLSDAQTAVDDAYVRNFDSGAQVQLGAFSSAEGAQELINELQQQGISAQMYQP